MSSMAAKVESAAKELGFRFAGYDGSGHIVWQHPNGARYSTPATPSEYRGVANSIAALERLSGRKIDRPNHRRSRKNFAITTDAEVEASRRRHAETFAAKADERDAAKSAELARLADAKRTEAAERRRREIEELMRP